MNAASAIAGITALRVVPSLDGSDRRRMKAAASAEVQLVPSDEMHERLRTVHALPFPDTARRIDETIGANPCDALRIPAPPKRQVEMLDIARWWIETEKLSPALRDLHRAMLLTGARRSSILNIRREDVDLEANTLRFT